MPRRNTLIRPDDVAGVLGAAVVRTRDLEAIGLARSTISQRCRPGGPWRSLAPGLVLLRGGPPTRDDRRRAALLHGGDGSVITGLDALALTGLSRVPAPLGPVHVLIPAARRRTSHGLALVERTERLPTPLPGRWPLAPVARAVLDFCRRCTVRDQVRSAIAEAVQRGFCTPAELMYELAAGGRWGRGLPGEVLREVGAGVRSVAEAKARDLILGSGLPVPMWNPALLDAAGRFLAAPDAWFDEVALAWEIDSVEWHLSPGDHAATLERHARLVAAGIVVVQDRPSRLQEAPAAVLDTLARALDQAARRPRPAVRAVPIRPPDGTSAR